MVQPLRHLRRLFSSLGVLAATAVVAAPPASADFVPLTSPAGAGQRVIGFAAKGDRQLAVVAAPTTTGGAPTASQLRFSSDGGQSWADVSWPFSAPAAPAVTSAVGASVGPDGKFHVTAVRPGMDVALVNVAPDTGTAASATVGGIPVPGLLFRVSEPVWDRAGHMWLAYSPETYGAAIHVLQLSDDGTTANDLVATGFHDSGLLGLETHLGEVWLRTSSKFGRVDPTEVVMQPAPVLRVGDIEFQTTATTVQGVTTTSFSAFTPRLNQVEGDPSLILQVLSPARTNVLSRFSDVFWSPTGLDVPMGSTRVIRNGSQLIAVRDESRRDPVFLPATPTDVLYAQDAPVPPGPEAVEGPVSPIMRKWMAQANGARAQAGLGPLVANAKISQASENHSRYWTLNAQPSAILSWHYETAGKPGFTGAQMTDRCAFVGTSCSSEIMGSDGWGGPPGWIETVFHRGLLMSPTAHEVGGAQVPGGPEVMDGGSRGGLLVAPTGYPIGDFDGNLAFGGEAPDPGSSCPTKNITEPYGTAISAYIPLGKVTGMDLRPEGGASVRACLFLDAGSLVPDEPLKKHTAYVATATWSPVDGVPDRTFSWRFVTGDGNGTEWGDGSSDNGANVTPCRMRATTVTAPGATVARRGGRWHIRVKPCRAKRVKMALRGPRQRVQARGRTTWKRTLFWSRELRPTRWYATTTPVPVRKLKPGRYQLQVQFQSAAGRRLGTSTIALRVTR